MFESIQFINCDKSVKRRYLRLGTLGWVTVRSNYQAGTVRKWRKNERENFANIYFMR